MNEGQKSEITRHGENLKRIFHLSGDPISISKRLRRVESEAQRYTTALANGETNDTEEVQNKKLKELLNKANKILNNTSNRIPIFINTDPRGYALKIDDGWVSQNRDKYPIQTDMGGYGIIAPEIR